MICDLGMPRNVDPRVADLPGVCLIGMELIQNEQSHDAADIELARRILDAELSTHLAEQRVATVVHAEVLGELFDLGSLVDQR